MAAEFLGFSASEDPTPAIRHIVLTQDLTSLTVATKSGYRLYSWKSINSLEKVFSSDDEGEILLAERLFSSSLLAVVDSKHPYKLRLLHFKKGNEICSYSYASKVLAIKLNRQRLVVCLEDKLYIHSIKDMKVLHTIRDTPSNPGGLFALGAPSAATEQRCYLAYPASDSSGVVQIYDTIGLKFISTINAHNNRIMALTFNAPGKLLATASEKGTVIRVFDAGTGDRLYEFRRGVKRCADIYCLSFSLDSTFLCCSSNTETVHVFKLETINDRLVEDGQGQAGWYSYLGQALRSSTSYLPTSVSDVLTQGRDFCLARLPLSGVRSICAVTVIDKMPRLIVVTLNGLMYVYNIDIENGGECSLVSQHRIDDESELIQTEKITISADQSSLTLHSSVANSNVNNCNNKHDLSVENSKLSENCSTGNQKNCNTVDKGDKTTAKFNSSGNGNRKVSDNSTVGTEKMKINSKDCTDDENSVESAEETFDDESGSIGDAKTEGVGITDASLQWGMQRRSYALAVQSTGALRAGPLDNTLEERCTAQIDLEEATQYEDALSSPDGQSPDALRIDDSAEFPSFTSLKRS